MWTIDSHLTASETLCEATFDSSISGTGYLETFLKIEDTESTPDQEYGSSGVPVWLARDLGEKEKKLYDTPTVWHLSVIVEAVRPEIGQERITLEAHCQSAASASFKITKA